MNIARSSEPLVSVVMPTYNQAQFINQAIESVLNQTYKNWELIIIDNYSNDATEATVKSYNDKRIRYSKFSNHGVIATSRNVGIKQSQGNYIAFLDSDDFWYNQKIELQVERLNRHPKVGLVYTRARVFGDVDTLPYKKLPHSYHARSGWVFDRLLLNNFIGTSTVMIRKACLNQIGFFDEDPQIIATEDFELWLRLAKHHKIIYLNKVLAGYRFHLTNLSSNNIKQLQKWNNVVKKIDEKIGIARGLKKRVFSKIHFLIAKEYILKYDACSFKELKFALQQNSANVQARLLWCLSAVGGFRLVNNFIGLTRFVRRRIACLGGR